MPGMTSKAAHIKMAKLSLVMHACSAAKAAHLNAEAQPEDDQME